MQRVAKAGFHLALIALVFHVDEVDDDQATKVAQAQLAGRFIRRLEVGAESCFLDVMTLGGARGVDVNRNQGLGVVDYDGAARGQGYLAGVGAFDLVLDLKAGEERHVIAVAFHAIDVVRHHMRHKLLRLFEDRIGIDQDFADFRMEIIADCPNHQAALLVNQESALL